MNATEAKTPRPVMGLYDKPMWESINAKAMRLQRCRTCRTWLYPPGPACPRCLSCELEWAPVSGRGRVVSWVVFHRQYLPAYPPPYNAISVRLEEGPCMISNLEGAMPDEESIGRAVRLVYATMPDGMVLPRFVLDGT
ncbi:nucleic acid-binding protein [Roseomonas hellenica]|uniref:Nucleic acid-binding protein n=1 Tax=Plastoroseomonas hellenica TaxID=2687306 RepID=A0ABS5EVT3_9PROT|nr:OB-fold domain-containing protein [Plastoroseomonas hellenica]MBR0664405.1 nucleic acid-binding protein [Plastoroseomonas hellenica]